MANTAASETFVDGSPPKVAADWLNRMDELLFEIFQGAETAGEVRTALGLGALALLDPVSGATVDDGSVTLAKMANLAQATIIGRQAAAGTGVPEALSATNVRTIINVENGATADQSDAEIETAYNTQVAAASQAEAEAGTESAIRRLSPLRVAQAIAALARPTVVTVNNAASPYTVTAANVANGYVILEVDISSGSVVIKVPDSAGFRNIVYETVIVNDAGLSSANKLTVQDDAGSPNEIGTYYLQGHGVKFIPTATATFKYLWENVYMMFNGYLSADDALAGTGGEKIFDASYTMDQNPGLLWDTSTNHRLDIPFAVHWRGSITYYIGTTAYAFRATFSIDGTNLTDVANVTDANEGNLLHVAQAGTTSAAAYMEAYAYKGGSAGTVYGDAAADETRMSIEIMARVR